jgi:hypothetical protein
MTRMSITAGGNRQTKVAHTPEDSASAMIRDAEGRQQNSLTVKSAPRYLFFMEQRFLASV